MRDLRWDNLRFVLIWLVVFGHLLELCHGPGAHALYQVIYTFHMPVFVFVTGYFAKFRIKTVGVLAFVYVLFQTLYTLFDWGFLHGAQGQLELKYAWPYWIMWYLMATVFYYLLVPALSWVGRAGRAAKVATLFVCIAVSLLGGYLPVSRFLTLGRFVAYLPCFVAGFYLHQAAVGRGQAGKPGRDLLALARKPAVLATGVLLACGGCAFLQLEGVSNEMLYNAVPYAYSWSGPVERGVQLAASAGWGVVLFAAMPASKVAFATRAGQCTMPVFLLHGFATRALAATAGIPFAPPADAAAAAVLATGMVLALGQPALDALLRLKLPRRAGERAARRADASQAARPGGKRR